MREFSILSSITIMGSYYLGEAREKQYQNYLAEAALEQEKAAERQRLREEKDREESFNESGGNSLNGSFMIDPIEDPQEYVSRKINSKKVVIFSKRSCPFST